MPDVARHTGECCAALAPQRESLNRHRELLLAVQRGVTRVPAPTGSEGARARWMARRFTALGLAPRTDTAGNVIARVAGASRGPAVVVCAHLDTVLPADANGVDAGGPSLRVEHTGERMTAPGICDNGRGLAVMLAIAWAVRARASSLARPVEFVATTGEEGAGDLRGAKHYFGSEPVPFAAIALDGAGDRRIVNGALGSRRFRVSFAGPGGHSWSAFGAANPVHAAGWATATLAALRLPAGSTLTVARIGGGHSVNAIPEDAWLEIDTRSVSAAALDRMEREVHEIVRAAVRRSRGRGADPAPLVARIEPIGRRPGGVTAEDALVVRAAIEATRLVGRTPELGTASTDANAAVAAGAPAIAIGGGGRGGDTHTSREWYDDTDGMVGVERALALVAGLATLPPVRPGPSAPSRPRW